MNTDNIINFPQVDVGISKELSAAIEQAASIGSYSLAIERQLWRLITKTGSLTDYKLALLIVKGNIEYIRNKLLEDLELYTDQAAAELEAK